MITAYDRTCEWIGLNSISISISLVGFMAFDKKVFLWCDGKHKF